jgi:alpha-L-rhamnosidase
MVLWKFDYQELKFFENLWVWGFTFIFFITSLSIAAPKLAVTNLRVEYKSNPVGIDIKKPRLSWEITSGERAVLQSAYQVRVAANRQDIQRGRNLSWDSGKIESDQSIHVEYQGPELQTGQWVYWQVKVWNQQNQSSNWSDSGFWEMGLLNPSDWKAEWIRADIEEVVTKSNPAKLFRKEFNLSKPIKSARAYITSLGLYEAELNGKKVGNQVLTPGWTSYDWRLQYQTYDVTSQLKSGTNAVGVTVGDGWYRGSLGFRDQRNTYGDQLALLAQINIEYSDGSREIIATNDSWKSSTGPILLSDIYNGETYDARLEKKGWSSAGYDDRDWQKVTLLNRSKNILLAPEGPPVRRIEEVKPIEIIVTPKGETVVDMGQNMVGWIRLKVQGPAGQTVKLVHAEVLDKEGNFYIENLRAAKQTISYTLKGEGTEIFEPHFTFQGFRYVSVEGFPGELTLDNLTGVVVHSDMTPIGSFESSQPLINQLQHNIQWGLKGNFVDVPTDCPQRDERLGWTGDAQVFAPTACFNMDAASFYTKWMKDFIVDQQPKGQIPHVIPNVLSYREEEGDAASAGWADAAVIVPWTVYLSFGDKRILEQQYDCMKKWVEYMRSRAGESYFWHQDRTFGDWLSFNTTRSDYPGATTDKDFITQAYFARSTDLLHRIAKILGKESDAKDYGDLLNKIKTVIEEEFLTKRGRLSPNTQTAYALALGFDLLPEDMRSKAAARLAEDVKEFEHITTGFLGAPLICHVLTRYGYNDLAYMLLKREEYPSWLYPVKKGATTIWERWDGIKPDGTFQNAGMNSFNHYAYGAIGEWMYKNITGINIDENQPGYKHIIVHPRPGGGFSSASAATHTMFGKVSSSWKIENSQYSLAVEIPVNTTATIILPNATLEKVLEGGKAVGKVKGITGSIQGEEGVTLNVGSGAYNFSYPWQE